MKENTIGFIENNNYEVLSVENGHCEMSAKITDTSLNPYNTAHGGFIFGLADTAAGLAAKSTGRNAMTLTSSINYLHAIRTGSIKAVANCIKDGKNISVYDVDLYDENDRLCVKSNFTYFYI